MHVPDDRVQSEKQMVHWSADLLDTEAQAVFQLVEQVRRKYAGRPATVENLSALRDEALTRLADELNIIAELDISPFYSGEPPTLEIIGKIQGDEFHKYGFDHEQKEYEVKKAVNRGEEYLGEKEKGNKTKIKKMKKGKND